MRAKKAFEDVIKAVGAGAQQNWTLDKYKPFDALTEKALSEAQGFESGIHNLYFFGPPGCGKTHLAVGIVLECFKKNKTVKFFPSGPELNRYFRGLEAIEESERMDRLSDVDVLVINELGIGRDTEFSLAVAVELIDRRIMKGKNGLIVTSNLHPVDLAQKMNDVRLESRFTGLCKIIEAGQVDYRKKFRKA